MEKRISFCTVAMDRLCHIKETLPKNLADNRQYQNKEFVLLDYSSRDGLSDWVRSNLMSYIERGTLKYFRTEGKDRFYRSHAKNMAAKCASGEIICNIDADNYTGKEFAFYVNSKFSAPSVFLMARENGKPDISGRICVSREDFDLSKGYDEDMNGYGWEDVDFCNRLTLLNRTAVRIQGAEYLCYIVHSDEARMRNHYKPNGDRVFVSFIDPSKSDFLLLFSDGRFKKLTIVDNYSIGSSKPSNVFQNFQPQYRYTVRGVVEGGRWTREGSSLLLHHAGGASLLGIIMHSQIAIEGQAAKPFNEIKGEGFASRVFKFIDEKINLQRLRSNTETIAEVNVRGCGKGKVTKNFLEEFTIF